MTRWRTRRGFTAIEALFAAVLLAVLTAAVSGALMAGRQQSKLARDTLSASFLAQALMDEIMRLPFDDPGAINTPSLQAGGTRRNTNNIGDYSGYSDGPSNLTDINDNAYPDTYQGFSRTVTTTAVSTSPSGWNKTLNGLLVTVSVSKDGVELLKLQRIAWQ
jgi:type II secretory pathway pseudopilin PulG